MRCAKNQCSVCLVSFSSANHQRFQFCLKLSKAIDQSYEISRRLWASQNHSRSLCKAAKQSEGWLLPPLQQLCILLSQGYCLTKAAKHQRLHRPTKPLTRSPYKMNVKREYLIRQNDGFTFYVFPLKKSFSETVFPAVVKAFFFWGVWQLIQDMNQTLIRSIL